MAYQPKSYRKFVATAATATLVASAIAPVAGAASNFEDVAPKYKDAVDYLVDNNITQGTTPTTFGTHDNIKRGDLAIWLAKALKLDTASAPASGFADTAGTRYDAAVSVLKAKGIVSGKSETSYAPSAYVTRGEMAIMLSRAYELTTDEKAPFTDMGAYAPYINGLYAYEITTGKTPETFGTALNITRGDLAIFLKRAAEVAKTPEVVSAVSTADNEVTVTFNTAISAVDHTNFAINKGMNIGKVTLSADGKTATLTLTSDLVDGETYEVTVKDVKSVKGDKALESAKVSFKYELTKIEAVTLTKTEFAKGENIKDYVTVKDSNGKTVDTEAYQISAVESTNTSVVETDGDVVGNAGETAKVRVTVQYKDGTTFKTSEYAVKVKLPATTGDVAGFFLESTSSNSDLSSNYLEDGDFVKSGSHETYANTAAYELDAKLGKGLKTSLYADGTSHYLHVFADDSDTNPMAAELDLADTSYSVTSSNATVATVTRDGNGVYVTGHNVGTTNIVITKGSYSKTVAVEVKAAPVFKDAYVGATSVTLSDQTQLGAAQEDVNQQTVELGWEDTNGNKHDLASTAVVGPVANGKFEITNPYGTGGKLVVSVDQLRNGQYPVELAVSGSDLVLTAVANQTVTNFDVKVTYHKADGTVSQKKIAVVYKDVNPAVKAVAYEIAPSTKELNANAVKSYELDTNTVSFTAFALDANGNRVADVSNYLDLSVGGAAAKWFTVADAVSSDSTTKGSGKANVTFKADAYKYLTETGNLSVAVAVDYNGLSTTQNNGTYATETIAYKNTFAAPKSVTVNTSPILVDLSKVTSLTAKDLVFGKINAGEFVVDGTELVAVKAGADGYSIKPAITVKGQDGNVVPFGALQYGLAATSTEVGGYGPVFVDGQELKFSGKITNASNVSYNGNGVTAPITVSDADIANALDITSGYKGTFTLVIDKVYADGENAVTGAASESNLLSAPVQIQVTIVK
ncbi:S-layer homology domain-containing protein [Mesobacillus jeotgali]|uniref:S-layer homology domain-containing protein n=1 Tax=Mesobacillus jeotgali TaxID=129985 RepID=UPI001784DA07|nr:S-layer homology domain-containing protein [Mesobacillus jeotgali]UYZ21813.1 S-layer homology domain-containing protein [Mesobacillus jeotgali]